MRAFIHGNITHTVPAAARIGTPIVTRRNIHTSGIRMAEAAAGSKLKHVVPEVDLLISPAGR